MGEHFTRRFQLNLRGLFNKYPPPLKERSSADVADFKEEVDQGQRFEFGKNWSKYLASVDENRLTLAGESLRQTLGVDTLQNLSLLDIGCGSGIFSLAAFRLGAKVTSFDFDPQSVACTRSVKEAHAPGTRDWVIKEGSILDEGFVGSLGKFDIVYSWGVLHHTGQMWKALKNAASSVKPGGKLLIAIYNDQGVASRRWAAVKKLYNRLPFGLKFLILIPAFIRLWLPVLLVDLLRCRPFKSWTEYSKNRGMRPYRDVVDWVGGYPFEVAKPEEIFSFHKHLGFTLEKLTTCAGGLGCNEYLFTLRGE